MRKFKKGIAIAAVVSMCLGLCNGFPVSAAGTPENDTATVTDAEISDSFVTEENDAEEILNIDENVDNLGAEDFSDWQDKIEVKWDQENKKVYITSYIGTEEEITFPDAFTNGTDTYELVLDKDTDYGCLKKATFDGTHFPDDSTGLFASTTLRPVDLEIITFKTESGQNVKNVEKMFSDCKSLKRVYFGELTFSQCENMSYMFNNCPELLSADMNNVDTSNCKNMARMFMKDSKLGRITGLGSFNVENVTDFTYMFYNCANLDDIDTAEWTNSVATSVSYMLSACSYLKNVYLNGFDLSNAGATTENMLANSRKLEKVYAPAAMADGQTIRFDTGTDKPMYKENSMKVVTGITSDDVGVVFYNKPGIVSSLSDFSYSRSDEKHLIYLNRYYGNEKSYVVPGSVMIDDTAYNIAFKNPNAHEMDWGTIINLSFEPGVIITEAWNYVFQNSSSNTFEKIDLSGVTLTPCANDYERFYFLDSCCSELDMSGLNMNGVTLDIRLPRMIETLHLPNKMDEGATFTVAGDPLFDEEGLGYIKFDSSMAGRTFTNKKKETGTWLDDFEYYMSGDEIYPVEYLGSAIEFVCPKTAEFNGKTYKVVMDNVDWGTIENLSFEQGIPLTDSASFFGHIKTVDIRNLDVSELTIMDSLFSYTDVEEVDMSDMDFPKLTSFRGLFSGCDCLRSVNLTKIYTPELEDISIMFKGCKALETVDIKALTLTNVTKMYEMFSGCKSLITLDLSGLDLSNVEDYDDMLYECSNLAEIMTPASLYTEYGNPVNIELPNIFYDDEDGYDHITPESLNKKLTLERHSFNGTWSDDFDFLIQDDMLILIRYNGDAKTYKIPATDTIKGTTYKTALKHTRFGTIENLSFEKGVILEDTWSFRDTDLRTINLTGLDTSGLGHMDYLLQGNNKLESVIAGDFKWVGDDTCNGVFESCENLQYIDISESDFSVYKRMGNVFNGCYSLAYIKGPKGLPEEEIEFPKISFTSQDGIKFKDEKTGTVHEKLDVTDTVLIRDDWPFSDVYPTDTGASDIFAAYRKGIVNGVTKPDDNNQVKYKPANPLSRAQFAIMLYNIIAKKGGTPIYGDKTSTFTDLHEGDTGYKEVGWAASNGIITGFSSGEFKPKQNITRAQITLMLMRFADYCKVDTTLRSEEVTTYSDYNSLNVAFRDSMSWAVASGIMAGKNKKGSLVLAPNDNATRAQSAMFVMRFIRSSGL
ncbi:MAG: BspA family leucine-rich repeat surface protein [Eubacterium sp.]|nr:BspA family leucine-rich repeat surface protein [Eubacterium sp.]